MLSAAQNRARTLPGLKAFVAAVLGGIGNLPGAALGALIIGFVETFVRGSHWSTYTDAIVFSILILILLFRPAGLLPAPVADGTDIQAAELAEVQRAYRTRTPASRFGAIAV